jgi:amidase
MVELTDCDATSLSALIGQGIVAPSEVMAATLARIGAVNPAVNAIVSLRDGDAMMAEAVAADDAPRKGWLHGIPLAVKDLADAEGLPTTQGSPLFAGKVAARDDGGAAAERGGDHHREDEHARVRARVAQFQPGLRCHAQPV